MQKEKKTLQTRIHVPSVSYELVVEKRFQLIEIYLNGVRVKAANFDCRFDLSPDLHSGENDPFYNFISYIL